jgi:predicted DNA-binding transcriptional regulator AlpA
MNNGLLDPAEVADQLGMPLKTLYDHIRNNTIDLPVVRKSERRLGFEPQDVEAYKKRHKVMLDGSGRRKKPAKAKIEKYVQVYSPVRHMTPKEIRDFFSNVERDEDGNLMCSPDAND